MTDTSPERPEHLADPPATPPAAPHAAPQTEPSPERTRFVDPPPAEAPAPERVTEPATEPPTELAAEPAAEPAREPAAPVPGPLDAGADAAVDLATEALVAAEPALPEPVQLAAPVPVGPADAGPVVAEAAPEEAPEASDVPAGRTGGTRLLAALVSLLLVAVGLLAWWAWPITSAGTPTFQTAGAAALTAAKADATLVLAYDYRHLKEGFAAAVKVTTDADGPSCSRKVDPQDKAYDPKANCFKSEYTRTHQKVVVDFATRYKTVVIAAVGAGGVEQVHGDQVTVLLYVNQQSTNNLSSSAKITQDRVEMVMRKVGGRWLVAGINAL